MKLLPFALLFLSLGLSGQTIFEENKEWRKQFNQEFGDSATSPLTQRDLAEFDSLAFFPISTDYVVLAKLELTPDSKPFKMKTTTDRLADYRQYGMARFTLRSKEYELAVYQNLRLLKMPEYENYLFVPFTDLTNGEETYAGGRYVEAEIPQGDTLVIDFNKAYNPYCTYNHKYSCPIPPSQNHLETKIKAGVLDFAEKKKKEKQKEAPATSPMR